MCVCVTLMMCFLTGELIRPPETPEQYVTLKVTGSIPLCNVTPLTLRQTGPLLSRLMLVFGTADTIAEQLLCSLSLNYSMKSYLLHVNVLLQNIWRAASRTTRKDGCEGNERNSKKRWNRDLFPTSPLPFFLVSYTWFHSRTVLTSWMNFRPSLRCPHFCAWWGRRGRLFLSQAETVRTLSIRSPEEAAVIAFSVEIIGQDTAMAGSACERGDQKCPREPNTITTR